MNNEELLRVLNDIIVKNLGHATAYGYAKSKGYTGTEEEFAELMADYAHVAQDAEAAAQAAAESATAAHNSEVNAGNSEGEAEQAKLDAQASAQAADVSEANAKISELNADTHAENSEAYAVGTRDGSPVGQGDPTYHNNAKYYAELADTKADQAAESADTATTKAGEASASAATAGQKATEASASATAADASKTAAKTSEDNAKASENTASNAAVSAMNSRDAAAGSATSAAGSASTATQKATEASQSATSASGSASTATQKATEASQSATSASGSASTATQKATEASNSAGAAAQSAADAAESATHVADMALMQAIAPKYDSTAQYKIGNLLSASGKMYLTIKDAPAGTPVTNTEYFEEKSVADIIEMIKQGAIVTAHSQVADNLTPYSEDSGTTQENPFISQGTGTDNNSVIVTTGAIARQLEKQGNTIVKNQFVQNNNFESTSGWSTTDGTLTVSNNIASFTGTASSALVSQAVNLVKGHKYLKVGTFKLSAVPSGNVWFRFFLGTSNDYDDTFLAKNTNWQTVFSIATCSGDLQGMVGVRDNSSSDWVTIQMKDLALIDLTQMFNGDANIPADLLANPSHFSWYYNGSLAYYAGSLQNCNGRYLECGQGRNLFAGNSEDNPQYIGHYYIDSNSNYSIATNNNYNCFRVMVIPNKPLYLYANGVSLGTLSIWRYVDKDYNLISGSTNGYSSSYAIKDVPANAQYVEFSLSKTSTTPIDVSLYYSPEEGGEGYNQHYDYVAPIRIDTGNETLKAFDKKLPSGVIEHNTGTKTFDANTVWYVGYGGYYTQVADIKKTASSSDVPSIKCSKYQVVAYGSLADKTFSLLVNDMYVIVKDSSFTDAASCTSGMTGVTIEYELKDDSKTTEQGTLFSEYAPINDYSYMAWFDTDGNLVSIPQGCKLFYPVDYKGFTDDLVMYTNGDATALAKNESIEDSALNARGYYKLQDLLTIFGVKENIGGMLRLKLAETLNVDFDNTKWEDMGDWSWNNGGGTNVFFANVSTASTTRNAGLQAKYKQVTSWDAINTTDKAFYKADNTNFYIHDSAYTSTQASQLKADLKGIICAFEKA